MTELKIDGILFLTMCLELPTAEELMRPIQLERNQIRGFSLRPVRWGAPYCELCVTEGCPTVATFFVMVHWLLWCGFLQCGFLSAFTNYSTVDMEKTSCLSERSSPDVASPDSQLKGPFKERATWSIRQEVERLMQEQNKYSSDTSSQTDRAKQKSVRHNLTFLYFSSDSFVVSPLNNTCTVCETGKRKLSCSANYTYLRFDSLCCIFFTCLLSLFFVNGFLFEKKVSLPVSF